MQRNKNEKRSPLKERPLRLPGQSVQDEINRLVDVDLTVYLIMPTAFGLLAAMDWVRILMKTPVDPWISTVFALAATAYCVFKWYRTVRKIKYLKLGRDGERIVAEQLDVLKQQGAVIIHDVVGEGFNLDHVILSKHGIFVAETKTWSKPRSGSPTVTYDGKSLLVDGVTPDRDPIAQAEMNARWLAKTLLESTGQSYPIRPVVLFPGWYVERLPRGAAVWVLEPKALPSFVEHEPVKISDSDLHLAAFHLTRLVRTTSR